MVMRIQFLDLLDFVSLQTEVFMLNSAQWSVDGCSTTLSVTAWHTIANCQRKMALWCRHGKNCTKQLHVVDAGASPRWCVDLPSTKCVHFVNVAPDLKISFIEKMTLRYSAIFSEKTSDGHKISVFRLLKLCKPSNRDIHAKFCTKKSKDVKRLHTVASYCWFLFDHAFS